MVARLAYAYYHIYIQSGKLFLPGSHIGIITPYRSQIALIREHLAGLGEPALAGITVDTVERYQGSERDFIIYSFCANRASQIPFLSNKILDDEQVIDRKLNVALTSARKQLVLIGNETLLSSDSVYQALMQHCRSTYAWAHLPQPAA